MKTIVITLMLAFGSLLVSCLHSVVFAQAADPFTLTFDEWTPVKVNADGFADLHFKLNVPAKHHLYREVMQVLLDRTVQSQKLDLPPGIVKHDDFMGRDAEVFESGDYDITLHVQVPRDFDFSQAFTGKLVYQGCSDSICFRAVKKPFAFVLYHPHAEVQVEGHATEFDVWSLIKSGDFQQVIQHGLPVALLITFLAGLVTAFTPCVLPVIPLTLAFMGVSPKRSVGQKLLALVLFVVGLCLMYASLGVFSALLGRTLGFQFQNPWFLGVLVFVFVLMGLWMLGVIDLSLPARMQNAITHVHPKGLLRDVYAGLTIGFLAAPCVGPIIGPLLVYISSTHDVKLGFVLMISYSLGLSVLFFFLAFFSRHWVKRFGVKSLWLKRILGILILASAGFYLSVLLAPVWHGDAMGSGDVFLNDLHKAEKKAKASGKGLLVDFYADWCVPCHEWEQNVWSKPEVQKVLEEKFVAVKINCTQETAACEEAVTRFDVIGWPTIIFTDSNGSELPGKRLVGQVLDAEAFLKYVGKIR